MTDSTRRVAMIVTDGFEDSEATSPIDAFREKGVEVTVIAPKTGTLTGKKGATIEAVAPIADATVGDFEMLIIPGGKSPESLRIVDEAVTFTRDFVESGKPVGTICHGPQLLISAEVLEGRTLTCVNTIRDDVRNAGATYVDEEVHVDANLISSRVPDDLPAWNATLLKALGL